VIRYHPGRFLFVDGIYYPSEERIVIRRDVTDWAFVRTMLAPFLPGYEVGSYSAGYYCELVAYAICGQQTFPTPLRRIWYLQSAPTWVDGLTLPAPCNNACDPLSIQLGRPSSLPNPEFVTSQEVIDRETAFVEQKVRPYWEAYRQRFGLPAPSASGNIAQPNQVINTHP
jgi:hypothetical protein